uniref:Fibronectin type-III domain-containing protein n=1 Tax=Knipowitschia caucasica TaxID=637954 RepID=A0AAV2MFJ6_KNICA
MLQALQSGGPDGGTWITWCLSQEQKNAAKTPTGNVTNQTEMMMGPVSSFELRNLTSLMEYSVAVSALYDEGVSEPLTDAFTTTPVPGPLNLRSSDITEHSFRVSWDHSAADIELYRLSWAPFTGGNTQEEILSSSKQHFLLSGLSASTEYEVMLTAVFHDESESDTVSLIETTLAQQQIQNLQVSGETTESLEASWEMEDVSVQSYRLTYAAVGGDQDQDTVLVPGGQRSQELQGLLPDTRYKVSITPLYRDEREGLTVTTTGSTLSLSPPQNLRSSEHWFNRFRISWDHPPSAAMGYRAVYQPLYD